MLGVYALFVLPLPNSPMLLSPIDQSVLSVFTKYEFTSVAETATTLLATFIGVGYGVLLFVPMPS